MNSLLNDNHIGVEHGYTRNVNGQTKVRQSDTSLKMTEFVGCDEPDSVPGGLMKLLLEMDLMASKCTSHMLG